MSLREILDKMIKESHPVLLNDGIQDWEAGALREHLSERFLKKQAYLQRGLYIAAISESGYLGEVLYKLKPKQ